MELVGGWLERWLGAKCPLCGGELDLPGLCRGCRGGLAPRRWQNLVYLGGYREFRGVVHALKFKGGLRLIEPLAAALARGVTRAGWPIEAVTAVPTTWWRRSLRGYNPSERLARGVAAQLRLPYLPLLARRYAPSQTRRRRDARARLKPGVFYLSRRLEARRILLIDDVWTTGATFRAVERVLRGAGAEAVFGAVIAARESRG